MKTVFESNQVLFLHHIKNILENHGIAAIVSGDFDAGIVSGCISQSGKVSVVVDEDEAKAKEIISSTFSPDEPSSKENWTCSRCREVIEPQFDECWKCGKSKAW